MLVNLVLILACIFEFFFLNINFENRKRGVIKKKLVGSKTSTY